MMKKNTTSKILILVGAIAVAIGGVLYFVKYVVSPPEDISAVATSKDVFNPNIQGSVAAFNPDSLNLKDAEIVFDALVDRAIIFIDDELIVDISVYDDAISESAEIFTKTFIAWSIDKFKKTSWNTNDHETMLRLITKMRNVSNHEGSQRALSQSTLSSLAEIESVVSDYKKALDVTRKTTFSSYQNALSVCNEAKSYATRKYLSNCTNLVNSLNTIGEKQENSRFIQLHQMVERLQYLYYFENREAYETESKRLYKLIREFKETTVFGVSTEQHARTLAEMQDRCDRISENYTWPDEMEIIYNQPDLLRL